MTAALDEMVLLGDNAHFSPFGATKSNCPALTPDQELQRPLLVGRVTLLPRPSAPGLRLLPRGVGGATPAQPPGQGLCLHVSSRMRDSSRPENPEFSLQPPGHDGSTFV